jgi:hypothetical protein
MQDQNRQAVMQCGAITIRTRKSVLSTRQDLGPTEIPTTHDARHVAFGAMLCIRKYCLVSSTNLYNLAKALEQDDGHDALSIRVWNQLRAIDVSVATVTTIGECTSSTADHVRCV